MKSKSIWKNGIMKFMFGHKTVSFVLTIFVKYYIVYLGYDIFKIYNRNKIMAMIERVVISRITERME